MLFEETNKIKLLGQKVEELLKNYKELKEENARLKNEIITLKASNDAKDAHIKRLEEKVNVSEVTGDDLLSKIEEVLNR